MQIRCGYKYELMPDGAQRRGMNRFAGACRYVFNQALALQQEFYELCGGHATYVDLAAVLTEWRHDPATAWLAEAPIHPLQQVLKDLDRAYSNFFAGRAERPAFKKKGHHNSFRYPDPKQFRLDQANSRVFLPKLG